MPVSEACQINDLDHGGATLTGKGTVSEACQINDLDHTRGNITERPSVSEACQINDLDHSVELVDGVPERFRSLSDQ